MLKVHEAVLSELVRRLPEMGVEVTGVHLAGGRVDIHDGERAHVLYFTDSGIAGYLKGGTSEGYSIWRKRMAPEEFAVRMLTITLQEDLGTKTPSEDGIWVFDRGFEPQTPWER